MRPKSWSFTPADNSTNGLGSAIATGGFGAVHGNMGDSLAHLLTFAPSASITGSYDIVGTDADGHAQSETLATNTTSTVTSAKYYLTVTSVSEPSGLGANTVNVGWSDAIVSPTIPVSWRQEHAGPNCAAVLTGTISITLQESFDNVLDGVLYPNPSQDCKWFADATFVNKTATFESQAPIGTVAVRLLINSLTAGATIRFSIDQPS